MRSLAIVNVVLGILMMAIVTSKLVSMKQERMLEQIYSLSVSEKTNRLISGLQVFTNEADNFLKEKDMGRKNLFRCLGSM